MKYDMKNPSNTPSVSISKHSFIRGKKYLHIGKEEV